MLDRHQDIINILHVDDDRIFLRLFQRKFSKYFNMTNARTGEEALEILKKETFDIILLDYILPDMDGVELIKIIKKDYPDIIVIFLTGKGSEEIARDAFLAGATDYFSKKIEDFAFREILLNSIKKAIEKKGTEKALKESKEKHKNIFRVSPEAIVILNKKANVIDVNERLYDWLGYTPEEVIGKNMMDLPFLPDESKAKAKKNLARRMMGYSIPPYELLFISKKGEELTGRILAAPMKNDKGEIFQDLIMISNITEQKIAEAELLRERDRAQKYLDIAGSIILALDTSGVVTLINRKGCSVLGCSEKEILGRNWFNSFVPGRIRNEALSCFNKLIQDGVEVSEYTENSVVTKTGDERLISWYNAILRNYEGEITGILRSGVDVTERRLAEEELRNARDELEKRVHERTVELLKKNEIMRKEVEARKRAEEASRKSRELLHLIMDNIPQFVFWKDRNSVFLGCNKSFARIAGVDKPEDIIGKTDYDFTWKKEKSDFYRECDQRIMNTGKHEYHIIEQQLQVDGTESWLETNKIPLRDENGEVFGILGTYEDVTERRKKDEELGEYRENLEEIVAKRTAELQKANMHLQEEIAERKKAEEALKKSEERFKDIFENSPISIWQEDFSGVKRYLDELRKQGIEDFSEYFEKNPREIIKCAEMIGINDVNKASLELYEAENKDDLLVGLDRILCEDSYSNLIKELCAIARNDTSFESETVNMTLTGKMKYVSLKWTVVPGFEETFENVLLTIFDITEQKIVERAIKRRLEFERIVSGISSMIINSVDFDMVINYSIEQMGKLGDADRSYLFLMRESQDILDNTHEWCAGGVEPQKDKLQNLPCDMFPWWMEKLRKGEIIHIGNVSKMPEEAGAERAILEGQDIKSLLVLPIRIKEGLVGFLGFDNTHKAWKWLEDDITLLRISAEIIGNAIERCRDSEKLERTMMELERSNRDLEQFAYIASHDLQEPLRMVTSYLELLEKRYSDGLDSNAIEFISYAVDGAQRMRGLINDLLMYSKVSTRARAFNKVDCSDVLSHALQNLKVAIEEKKAIINKENLPMVMGDSSQLIQLFQNLISNALKFQGNKNPIINISCKEKEKEYEFSFKDNGIGIDPGFLKDIFLPFRRLHTREEYPGSGIGLAVCKKIVERHGGVIWAESKPANGATFFITIMKF